jgi:hypothetical protein
VVDIGLGHLAEKLPGERGQTLHVASLTLGVEGVERERTLPTAAHTGEANEFVPGENQVDVAEVVFPRAFDDDIRGGHTSVLAISGRMAATAPEGRK